MHWSAGAVARMLGVSPVTLRTWDRRYGLGPSTREEGRHRRYSEQDVARLRRMLELTGHGVTPASAAAAALDEVPAVSTGSGGSGSGSSGSGGSGPGGSGSGSSGPGGTGSGSSGPGGGGPEGASGGARTAGRSRARSAGRSRVGGARWARFGGGPHALGVEADEARGFAHAASRLDAPLMSALAASLIRRDGVVGAWEGVLAPYLIALGDRISASGSGIEVEHLASAAIAGALRTEPLVVDGRLPALLACAPEELHSLPLDALAAALAERGCASRNLGARVPAGALLDAVNLLSPRVVVLWAHADLHARLAPVAELLELRISVVVGGAGWTTVPEGARRVESLAGAVGAILELNRF
ncbi:MerR family transcriptional regulator [Actinosynnema sp. NPDC023587]|uniref:MerR family transcriptional regulator n=1 Tax=Actinosynnema sp. NPDC023587 TaxID=3154695 RepID=UPI0033E93F10